MAVPTTAAFLGKGPDLPKVVVSNNYDFSLFGYPSTCTVISFLVALSF